MRSPISIEPGKQVRDGIYSVGSLAGEGERESRGAVRWLVLSFLPSVCPRELERHPKMMSLFVGRADPSPQSFPLVARDDGPLPKSLLPRNPLHPASRAMLAWPRRRPPQPWPPIRVTQPPLAIMGSPQLHEDMSAEEKRRLENELGEPPSSSSYSNSPSTAMEDQVNDTVDGGFLLSLRPFQGMYCRELEVALCAVQLACFLSQRTQERLLRNEEKANSKTDRSLVTVADWGVQAVISWVLSQSFSDEISMVAEEDTDALKGMDGINILQRVVHAVNECLSASSFVGMRPPDHPLGSIDVLKAINKGCSKGGSRGRYWVLDPVDGTLGFVRGDQYAIALSMIEDGEVVLGVLGCPNFPMRKEWLRYNHRYYRLMSKLSPPSPHTWHKGCIFTAQKGGGGAWMHRLVWDVKDRNVLKLARPVSVSPIDDSAEATFCEPVEKANSSHSFTAGLASSIGLRKRPLRLYSMAKYGAIARGDAEIFMKFAKSGYKEKIWDHAAGVLIVQEAGGVVTDAGGKPLDFSQGMYLEGLDRGIIAASGKKLHEKLIEAVDASWNSSRL